MPGLTRKVKVLKSADTSGMAASVFGRMRVGLARNSNSKGDSSMPEMTVREYRSLTCTGSKLVSAMRKAYRSTFGACAFTPAQASTRLVASASKVDVFMAALVA